MKAELQRWTVVLFADSAEPFTDAGVAESPDGKADVLETKDAAGRSVRLFVDAQTHLPLMLHYQEIRPRFMMAGGPGGPGRGPGAGPGGQRLSEEEMQRRVEEMRKQGPPQPSAFAMHLSDYKKVDGGCCRQGGHLDRRRAERGVDDREVQGQPFDQGRELYEAEIDR